MYKIISFLLIIFLLVPGCEKKENKINEIKTSKTVETMKKEEPDSANIPEIRKPKTEEDFLMIIDFIPLNSSYNYVKQVFPNASEIDKKIRRYNKSYLYRSILNRNTKLEFTFNAKKTLENIRFFIYSLNCSEADSLYSHLQKYYKKKFGEYNEEIANLAEDSDYPYPILHSSQWKSNEFDIIVDLNESHKDCSLLWKYIQKQ